MSGLWTNSDVIPNLSQVPLIPGTTGDHIPLSPQSFGGSNSQHQEEEEGREAGEDGSEAISCSGGETEGNKYTKDCRTLKLLDTHN